MLGLRGRIRLEGRIECPQSLGSRRIESKRAQHDNRHQQNIHSDSATTISGTSSGSSSTGWFRAHLSIGDLLIIEIVLGSATSTSSAAGSPGSCPASGSTTTAATAADRSPTHPAAATNGDSSRKSQQLDSDNKRRNPASPAICLQRVRQCFQQSRRSGAAFTLALGR